MGCDLQSYRAVVGQFVSVLVEILSRYASIAAKRVRGAETAKLRSTAVTGPGDTMLAATSVVYHRQKADNILPDDRACWDKEASYSDSAERLVHVDNVQDNDRCTTQSF